VARAPGRTSRGNPCGLHYPSLAYYGAAVYPSGPALAYPSRPTSGILVDDGTLEFDETPDGCWAQIATGSAQNGSMSYVRPRNTTVTCSGQWPFPRGANDGIYAVYVRIPAIRATSEGAIYTIRHAGRSDQVVVNQAVFPNFFYVTDGWVYVGKYNFTGAGDEYVELSNRTQDESASIADLYLGADAVRFVFQGDTTPTPSTPVTVTPTTTPSIHPNRPTTVRPHPPSRERQRSRALRPSPVHADEHTNAHQHPNRDYAHPPPRRRSPPHIRAARRRPRCINSIDVYFAESLSL
jgi:hypothetical protein